MVWIESPSSRDNSDVEKQLQEQKRLAEQKEKSRPPESEQDARLKMGLWVLVGDFKWKMTGQATEWKTRLQTMKEKEWFLNSLSPENLWGYSWLVNGVKDSIQTWEMKFDTAKTNSALKTDIVEAYSELLNRRLIVLPKLEYMLQSWQRWEDIRNDAGMRQFFITPEGEYILALARGENPKDTEATYTLAKARELKKYIPKGELYAQPLYEQLKGTKYESIANQEKMNIAETAWKKYISEVGNELLGTDSLAIMAISGPVWWALAKAVQWERAVAITQNSINAVNKSGIAKTLVPWVRVLWKEASDTIMMKLGKWTLNIAVDATKIVAYTETVRQLGWNDAAKYASYVFLFIPWAKMAFERDMLARPTSHITSETILSWALAKIWPERLKQFFQSQGTWIETNASQVATGAEQAVQEMQELAKTATINTGTTETGRQTVKQVSQEVSHAPSPQPKKTDTPKATWPETTKEQPQEQLPETTDTTKQVRDKVANVIGDSPEMTELLKAGLPRGYILALKEHWIDESTLLKMKWWSGKKPEEVQLINDAIRTHNQDALQNNRPDLMLTPEEWHAIYGYSTNLFFRTLNGALWRNEWGNLSLTNILQSGLEKLPLAKPTQYRGDNHLLNEVLQGRPVSKEFLESPEWVKFLTELEWKRFTLKGFTSSADNPADTFLEEGGIKYYLTIHGSSAKDITPLAVFPNFGDKLKVPKLQPDGTTKLEFGQKTSQESVFPPWTEIVINKAKKDEINGNTFISIEASEVPKK